MKKILTSISFLSFFTSGYSQDTTNSSTTGITIELDKQEVFEKVATHFNSTKTVAKDILSTKTIFKKENVETLTNLFDKKFKISGITTHFSSYYNRNLFSNEILTAQNLSQYNLSSTINVDVFGIPFNGQYIRRESTPSFIDNTPRNWWNYSMDIEKYRNKWKSVAEKLGPESLTKSGAELKALKEDLSSRLLSSFRSKAKEITTGLYDSLTQQLNLAELQSLDPQQLEKKFFGQNLNELLQKAKTKLYETEQAEMVSSKKDSIVTSLKKKINDLENKIQYVNEVRKQLEIAKASGLLTNMNNLDKKAKEEYEELLQNPQMLAKKVEEKFKISGLSKILMLLSQFKVGKQSFPVSNVTNNIPFLSNGISFEFNLGDKLIGFSTGKILPVMNDLFFNRPDTFSTIPNDQSSYWFLHYRKGKLNNDHKGIKLTSIQNHNSNNNSLEPTSLIKKNTVILNIYSKERIFGDNWLSLEASKSIVSGGNPKQSILNLNNTSFKISTEGRIEKPGITHHFYYSKLVSAFNNFTESQLSSNGYESGFSFRMKPKKSRFSSYLKGSLRSFRMPGSEGSKWNTSIIRSGIAYRSKKGQMLQLTGLFHEGYRTYIFNSLPTTIQQHSKNVTADISFFKRIFGLYGTSFLSLGFQRDGFPFAGFSNNSIRYSNSYNFLLNQTFLLNDHLLQINIYYTKVSNELNDVFYNSRLEADGGGTFRINENFSTGASLVFGYLKDAYTNVGIKPSLSALVSKKIHVALNGDLRRNIKVSNPVFDQFTNVSCDIKYTIK